MQNTIQGWTADASPFHTGEREIQTRLGVRDKMETIGRRFIRQYMPDQHRQFYQQLPFLILGSLDDQERPWASVVTGEPDFIHSPDEVTLVVNACPLPGDPLNDNLHEGSELGLLGIDLATRRRNRMNGRVSALTRRGTGAIAPIPPIPSIALNLPDPPNLLSGFTITVTQSFGNCPQFIQKRQLHWLPERLAATHLKPQRYKQFTPSMGELVTQADAFFIATSYCDRTQPERVNQGVDVSHRGGKPGFVRLDNERTFTFPDFAGNNFYNTIGNLSLNPKVGVLFIDFEQGHLLTITGHAEIIWDQAAVAAYSGAERLVRITVDEMVYLPEILPFRWQFEDYSPSLGFTGEWSVA